MDLTYSKPRMILGLALWFGLGLWGLDRLSAHRSLICIDHICSLSEKRLSQNRTVATFSKNDIVSAEDQPTPSVNMLAFSSQLVLHTSTGDRWLSDDDISSGLSKLSAADQINDYIADTQAGNFSLNTSWPTVLWVMSVAYTIITLFLIAPVVVLTLDSKPRRRMEKFAIR